MKLLEIWNADLKKGYETYMSFNADENGFENPCIGMDFEMYKQYVSLCYDHSKGINLRSGYVPDTKYFLVNDNNEYVGILNLRHHLNEFLENGPGHIGYGISKNYRHQGYGNEILKLGLEKCKQYNIDEAYLSVNINNEPSLKVQLKNGAVIHHQDNEHYYTRIKIV